MTLTALGSKIKPSGVRNKASYTVLGYDNYGYGWSPSVMDDGCDGGSYAETLIFGYAQNYIELNITSSFRIWRLASAVLYRYAKLNTYQWNGSSYVDITSRQPNLVTSQSTNTVWEAFTCILPAGKYKFQYGGDRLDAEWYIESIPLQTSIDNMNIGDYISCEYTATSGAVGTFANLGNATKPPICPEQSSATPDGTFYFVKVGNKQFVADRNIQHSVSWDTLNAGKVIQGLEASSLFPVTKLPSTVTGVTGNVDGDVIYYNNYLDASRPAWKTFDGTVGDDTAGYATNDPTGYIGFRFNSPKTIKKYALYPYKYSSTLPYQAPTQWQFQASNDGTSWTTLHTVSSATWNGANWISFVINNSTAYTYYRIYGITVSTYKDIGEIAFYEYNKNWVIRSLTGGNSFTNYISKQRNVATLLHMEGSNGSTNFVDSCPIPNFPTIVGNVQIKTDQYKFGSSSAYFDGSSYLSVPHSELFNFGVEDFTIDFWFRPTTLSVAHTIFDKRASSGVVSGLVLSVLTDGSVVANISSNTSSWDIASNVTFATGVVANQWNHITLCRTGGYIYGFVNGVKGTPLATSATISSSTSPVLIGSYGGSTNKVTGYIDEFRVIKGKAEYKNSFTPPTAPYSEPDNELTGISGSTTDKGLRIYPNNNEWDNIITKSTLNNTITAGSNSTWNWNGIGSYCQEVPMTGFVHYSSLTAAANTDRIWRGYQGNIGEKGAFYATSTTATTLGFRPVLEIKE